MDPVNQFGIHVEHDISAGGNRVGMHEHVFYELYFLVSGQRRYLMQHTVFDVEPGNLLIIPKMHLHRATSATQTGYDRYVLYFSDRQAEKLASLIGTESLNEMISGGCIKLPGYISKQIHKDMEEIRQELQSPTDITDAVVTHLFHGIMLNALRYGSKKEHLVGESADKVQMIAKYITEHYNEEISLSMAANMAYLERTYFSKRFKHITGFGFQEYLLQTRILAAEKLLLETSHSVSKISVNCGFSCSNYFGDVFRRFKGISPSEYRRKYRSEYKRGRLKPASFLFEHLQKIVL